MDTTHHYTNLKHHIRSTDIGYGHSRGVSWLVGEEPFAISPTIYAQLKELEELLFWMTNCIQTSYRKGHGQLRDILEEKVPNIVPRLCEKGSESTFRLDLAVDAEDRIYITEREECGGAKGMLSALCHAYGVPYNLPELTAHRINGEPFYIILTKDWWEYYWDLHVFAQSLEKCGVKARVYYAKDVRDPAMFPQRSTVYLFGYFDNFARHSDERWVLDSLRDDISVFNSRNFYRESKVMLSTVHLPFASEVFPDSYKLERLRRFIPWTMPLSVVPQAPINWGEIVKNSKQYLLKIGGYDGTNQCWGGRGVDLDKTSNAQFAARMNESFASGYPVVVQRKIKQKKFNVAYYTEDGELNTMNAHCRLSPFYIKTGRGKNASFKLTDTLATFAQKNKVHGTPESIMVPCVYSS